MRRNKIGVMFIVTALALAGVGITYAGWTDTITVSGTAESGDVDMNIVEYSGTWVYKVDDHGIAKVAGHYGPNENPGPDNMPADILTEAGYYDEDTDTKYEWVAAAWAEPTPNVDDSVTITFENLFPCQDFVADFIVEYDGSIPARLARSLYIETNVESDGQWTADQALAGGSDWMDDLYLYHGIDSDFGIWLETYDITGIDNPDDYVNPDNLVEFGYQVHEGDMLYFRAIIHIPQNNIYQGCSGSFDFQLFAMQWDTFDDEIGDLID